MCFSTYPFRFKANILRWNILYWVFLYFLYIFKIELRKSYENLICVILWKIKLCHGGPPRLGYKYKENRPTRQHALCSVHSLVKLPHEYITKFVRTRPAMGVLQILLYSYLWERIWCSGFNQMVIFSSLLFRFLSCYKVWIYWVGVYTKFTTWQLYILYLHPPSKFEIYNMTRHEKGTFFGR